MMRLPKDGKGSLPTDMTLRRGRRGGEDVIGGDGVADADAAIVVPWWSAACCRRRALAAAPLWRRR